MLPDIESFAIFVIFFKTGPILVLLKRQDGIFLTLMKVLALN